MCTRLSCGFPSFLCTKCTKMVQLQVYVSVCVCVRVREQHLLTQSTTGSWTCLRSVHELLLVYDWHSVVINKSVMEGTGSFCLQVVRCVGPPPHL